MKNEFWKNRTVFVTGHEGFVGSWLSRTLIENNSRVIGVDIVKDRPSSPLDGLRRKMTCIKGDIADIGLVKRLLKIHSPSVIFHLAAEALVGEAHKNPLRTFRSNIEGTWNILEASRDKRFIEAIVAASSDKAYGPHPKLPYREGAALKGNHPYDVSKSCADLLCQAYHHTYDVPVSITRCGNIYGPGDYHFSRIVPDTIRSIIRKQPLIIRSDGRFVRDYIYIEDIIAAYMRLAEEMRRKNLAGEAFNFSNESPLSVLTLVNAIYRTAGERSNYKILNTAKYEIKAQYLSAAKARKILGWRPRHTLREGLLKTIKWYRNRFSLLNEP